MANNKTSRMHPKAMMTSTPAMLREVASRQRDPSGFLHLGPVFRAVLGSTDVRLSRLTPQVGAPYDWIADCNRGADVS
jgi:hypothetical protein